MLKMGVVFEFAFQQSILEGLVTVGKYDGRHPSLTCATVGGRVMVHSSRPKESSEADVQMLNFSKVPKALMAASFQGGQDILFVGSATSIVAYNVEKNGDIFYRDVADGVSAMTFGPVVQSNQPLALVGGNCSVLGYDAEGNEAFWTVMGDNVTAMTTVSWGGGSVALVAASEDFEIRMLTGEESQGIINEVDRVRAVTSLSAPRRFAYSLHNGTVGVYQEQQRAWRLKGKHTPISVAACDVDYDGVPELLIGWDNGKFEVRYDSAERKSEPLFKETFASAIQGIAVSDYRLDGRTMPIVCLQDGSVRGLLALETGMNEALEARDEALLTQLMAERQQLQSEITNLDQQIAKIRESEGQVTDMPSANVTVSGRLVPRPDKRTIELQIEATEGGLMRAAIITAEIIFSGNESAFFYSDVAGPTLECCVATERDTSTELNLAILVGNAGAASFQVHDILFKLPKFAMFVSQKDVPKVPEGKVTLRIVERMPRLIHWLATSFNSKDVKEGTTLDESFTSLRDGTVLSIQWAPTNGGEMIIRTDSMDLCGEVIQDMASSLGISELTCVADFPQEFESFRAVLQRVDEYNGVRMKLTAEIADSTQVVKALVIKAEDARILCDMRHVKKMYGALYEINRELMGEYMKRSNNHNELLAALKEVNAMIQRAGKLRVGTAKTFLISECRNAIKANNIHGLFNIIRTGSP